MKTYLNLSYFKYIQLSLINLYFNLKIKYKHDNKNYGKDEYWTVAKDTGDCEDYALAKLFYLIKHNNNIYSPFNLLLTECITEDKNGVIGNGEYHSVLSLKTNKGFYIMDNRFMMLYPIIKSRYSWKKIMCGSKWFKLELDDFFEKYKKYKYKKYMISKIIFNGYYLIRYLIFHPKSVNITFNKTTIDPIGFKDFLYRYKNGKFDFKNENLFWNFYFSTSKINNDKNIRNQINKQQIKNI